MLIVVLVHDIFFFHHFWINMNFKFIFFPCKFSVLFIKLLKISSHNQFFFFLHFLCFWYNKPQRVDLRLKWSLKQSCICRRELSNGMSHTTCTQGNWGDSQLLMVGSQIANLTLNPAFGYNLCVRCPNGSCEPILDI
jgi:hypothetical protein